MGYSWLIRKTEEINHTNTCNYSKKYIKIVPHASIEVGLTIIDMFTALESEIMKKIEKKCIAIL